MRICIITDEKNSYSSKKFLREAGALGIKIFFTPWKELSFNGLKNEIALKNGLSLKKFDAVILRSSTDSIMPGNLVVEYCQKNHLHLLNKNFYSRYQSADKVRQQIIFQTKGIPSLATVCGETLSFSFLKKTLGLPFIAKLAHGSLGKQVFKINSLTEFRRFLKKRQRDKKLYLFQKFYRTDGDFRVFIIGGKIFGPLKRIAPPGEWKTNMHGSSHERATKNKEVPALARTFFRKTGIDFAGLDILLDASGKPRLIEYNTMACFRVFDEIFPEVNVARKTLQFLKNS